MILRGSFGFRYCVGILGAWFLLCGMGLAAAAQELPVPQNEPVPTLHVYMNLIQIPVLVLGPHLERIKDPIPERRFSVSIAGGPWFPATHARQEGDDPISLSILLDLTGREDAMSSKLAEAIADLAPLSLRPRDHVSIYALNCSLQRSLEDVPAEHHSLKQGVEILLKARNDNGEGKEESACAHPAQLWDALGQITKDLYHLPGRRVILAVTNGRDKGSGHRWNDLRTFAQVTGVAIFGLSYLPFNVSQPIRSNYENIFSDLCELSGGMVLRTNEVFVAKTLMRFTELLRERYIVEFPRPAHATAGPESMLVKIDKSKDDFIRPAGIAVPTPDAAVLADPTTVPSNPSLTPEVGNRKIMMPPQ